MLSLLAEGMPNGAIAARLFVNRADRRGAHQQVFLELRLPEAPDTHGRVLAMLAFLRA